MVMWVVKLSLLLPWKLEFCHGRLAVSTSEKQGLAEGDAGTDPEDAKPSETALGLQ